MNKIKDKVYNFKTKSEYGFTQSEMEELLKDYPNVNMDKFNNAMMGNTCMVIEGEVINYHIDVYHALLCGIENRGLKTHEWD